LDLRHNILQNFEKALNTTDPLEKESLMNFVIVGGGPTGVELAGALAELQKHVLPCDYPELDMSQMKIYLIEASPRVLNSFHEKSSVKADKFLTDMGVTIMTGTGVTDYDANVVKTNKGHNIPSNNLIWAAGVAGNALQGLAPEVVNRGRRIEVDEYNRVKGYENIYAIGDVAAMYTEAAYPKGHPMVAQVAIQQGKLLAKNFNAITAGKVFKPFHYKDKGSMATVGRNRAVVEIGNYRSQGVFAWFMSMFVHLVTLVGFRNKLVVFINWLVSYWNYDRGMRLIIRPFKRAAPGPAQQVQKPSQEQGPSGNTNAPGGVPSPS
jgi:NADH dehydrogenase